MNPDVHIPPFRALGEVPESCLKLTANHYLVTMAKGPKGERRSADVNARALMTAKIATGEIDETTNEGKNAAAVALGRRGGQMRAKNMSKKQRIAIAKKGAKARWHEDP